MRCRCNGPTLCVREPLDRKQQLTEATRTARRDRDNLVLLVEARCASTRSADEGRQRRRRGKKNLLMADADDNRDAPRAVILYGGRDRCARVTAGWLMFIISTSRVRETAAGD